MNARHTLVCIAVSLAATCLHVSASAKEDTLGLQPGVFVASCVDQETVRFVWYTESTVLVTKTTDVQSVDQKPVYVRGEAGRLMTSVVKETKTTQAMYTEEEKTRLAQNTDIRLEELTAFSADGREITREQLRTLLAEPRPVVVSSNGSIVDPFFLSMLRDDTLVFVSRSPDFPPSLTRPMPPAATQPSPSDVSAQENQAAAAQPQPKPAVAVPTPSAPTAPTLTSSEPIGALPNPTR
jgi:hypothetical protein